LNQIQVVGTHNSYHVAQPAAALTEIAKTNQQLAESLDYTHRPLADQFSLLGVRQIELDVFVDPDGGLYAKPSTLRTIAGAIANHDPRGVMEKPGLKILHVQDVDFRTTVLTLVDALKQVKSWLDANPQSCPIMVMLELKQSSMGPEYTQPVPFNAVELDSIDKEILSVFKPQQIVRPDDVREEEETLRAAVLKNGWPTLAATRGKVIFAMDNGGELRDAYLKGHPALRDRLLFVSVDETHPAAAFMKINDPIRDFDRIQNMVRKGFLVRTRADGGTRQSRMNDPTQRDKALESGAQFISTDYPEPDTRFSSYQVRLPNSIVARANPVSGATLPAAEYDLAEQKRWSPVERSESGDALLSRIAFGSCAKQDQPQPIWKAIVDVDPELFLFIGDNIYGDSTDIEVLRAKYGRQGKQPGFRQLAQHCPMLGTWDDHDYGANDAGVEFPIKRESQRLFLDFFGMAPNDPRRERDGVYSQSMFGPKGKRVQVILLDTRFFRSPLKKKKNTRLRAEGYRGDYVANHDETTTVLGEQQWQWLEEQLRKPAEVRIIVSSIQVISNEHGWEKWGNFPHERKRLFETIRRCDANGVVILSGDRHLAEISAIPASHQLGVGYPLYEVTSSSLNSPSNNFTKSGVRFVNEVNEHRVGLTYFDTNFGVVEIDWTGPKPLVKLKVLDEVGGLVLQQSVDF